MNKDEQAKEENDNLSSSSVYSDMARSATANFLVHFSQSSPQKKFSFHNDFDSVSSVQMTSFPRSIKNSRFCWKCIFPCRRQTAELAAACTLEKRYGVSYKDLLNPTQRNKPTGKSKITRQSPPLKIPLKAVHPSRKLKEKLNNTFQTLHTKPTLHPKIQEKISSCFYDIIGKSLDAQVFNHLEIEFFFLYRNLKCDLFELVEKMPDLEPSTVAIAWIYFERLVLKRVIKKENRKQYAGACLMLAFKFNEALRKDRLKALCQVIRMLDRKDNLSAHAVFTVEFKVFSLNNFELQVSFEDIAEHLLEYFAAKNKSFEEEYGVSPSAYYNSNLLSETPFNPTSSSK